MAFRKIFLLHSAYTLLASSVLPSPHWSMSESLSLAFNTSHMLSTPHYKGRHAKEVKYYGEFIRMWSRETTQENW